ncbi:tetratricopeptide repeat protein [Streptomyces sp. NPDC006307]|uniref:tetratricopeptide repeat protein n=1 Tax=Streptomyces sp. NPDC006307 TaxID=3156748 RepID=UPI0033A04DDB
MSNRFSLVIAAQWDGSGRHLDDLARQAEALNAHLLDDDRGGCLPAHGGGLLLDPDGVEAVRDAVAAAFAHTTASAQDGPATLLLAFLGHGVGVRHDDFLYPVATSPAALDVRTAYSVPAGLRDGLTRHGDVRALAVVIDACQSGVAALAAAQDWFPASMERGREIAVLTSASTDQPAYGLSFVREVNRVLRDGHARLDRLLHHDQLRWAAGSATRGQQPQTVAHGGAYSGPDPARPHWIAKNAAYVKAFSVLAFSPPGEAQLTHLRRFQTPESLPGIIDAVTTHRAVAVVGRKGYGKSVLAAALCRPELLAHAAKFRVTALHHLGPTSADERVLSDVARQLAAYLPGFAAAQAAFRSEVPQPERNAMPPQRRLLAEPLSRCASTEPVRVVVDALDQMEPSQIPRLTEALDSLVEGTPPWFGIVVTSRDGIRLPASWHRLPMTPASDEQIKGYLRTEGGGAGRRADILRRAAGNWQTVRLLVQAGTAAGSETLHDALYEEAWDRARRNAPGGRAEWVDAVLNVLGAVGQGPVLPRPLLLRAAAHLHGPGTEPELDQVLELLPGLLSRVPAPRVGEMIGADHQTMVDHIAETAELEGRLSPAEGHRALAEALGTMAPMTQHDPDDPLHAYARDAEPVHLWELGEYQRVLASLEARPSTDAAANRDRWLAWCERLSARPGPEHIATLRARQHAAYWAGRAGSYSTSRAMYEAVLEVQSRVLPPDDEDTLESRHRIAYATGQTGRFAEAVALHRELLATQTRVLGPDDRRTLETRHHIAYWTGRGGAMAEGLRLHEELLPHQIRVLGPTHRDVLESRHYIAYWYGRLGRPDEALAMHERLLRDRVEVFGEDHEQVVFSRMNICKFTAEGGRPREGLAAYRDLLPQVERVKSPHHPDALLVRLNIARYTWELGDPVEGLRLHEELLADQRRVNGDRHPTVLITRHNIAWIHGETGDPERAVRELTALRDERIEVYGSEDHPEVLTTRLGIAWWTAAAGDPEAGVARLRTVLADRARVLGDGHPDVLDARSRLGELLGRAGAGHAVAAEEAVELLSATAAEQARRNGARHPHTLATRARLADVLLRTGRPAEARELLAGLLPHQAEVLGSRHPATRATENALAPG